MTWIPLHLTSPHMTDKSVHRMGGAPTQVTYAQKLLKQSRFGHSDPGAVDGEYGLHSAQAAERAHYWAGYSKLRCTRRFDARLLSYLQGQRITPLMYSRRRRRVLALKRREARTPRRVKAANLSLTKVGVHESPAGSNRCEFSVWYGFIGAWCAMLETWAGVLSGQRSFVRGRRYAYVPYITADAISGRNGLSVTHDPQKGDLVVYVWPGGNPAGDHTGRFLEWTQHGYSFTSVDGNTSTTEAGSQDNGGIVAVRVRYMSNVLHFVKVRE